MRNLLRNLLRMLPFLPFLPLLLAHWAAQAQARTQAPIYVCKDAAGRTFSSDRPIAECADRPIRQFDRQGLARREILPPPTAKQKQQMQVEEEKRKAQQAALEEQRRNDRAIQMRYSTEGDIKVARERELEMVQEHIKRESVVLAAAEKKRQQVQNEAESRKKNSAALPPDLQRRIDESDEAVRDSKKAIEEREAEITQINAKYDQTLKRYREINGVAAAK